MKLKAFKAKNFLLTIVLVVVLLTTTLLCLWFLPTAQADAVVNLTNETFIVEDNKKVWTEDTDIEIFKTTYTDNQGKIVVLGSNSNKVLAPGTSNTYTFTLKNTSLYEIEYSVKFEATFLNELLTIPIKVKLKEGDEYILGSDEAYQDVTGLNQIDQTKKLQAEKEISYTLQWMWEFEGNDEIDTVLGNLAEGNAGLTIGIKTQSRQISEEEKKNDSSTLIIIIIVVAAVIAIALAVLIPILVKKKKKVKENEQETK